jgi:hemin uptake protein HemP
MPDKPLPTHATALPPFAPIDANGLLTHSDSAARRRYVSQHLLGGNTEVEILHGEAVYRLRLTALGKLILTK